MISIMLIVANFSLRQALKSYLNSQRGLKIIAEAEDGLAGVETAADYQPNVVITGLMLPKLHGLEVVRQIHQNNAGIKIIVVSLYDDPAYYKQCFKNGAAYCISKSAPFGSLLQAIRENNIPQ